MSVPEQRERGEGREQGEREERPRPLERLLHVLSGGAAAPPQPMGQIIAPVAYDRLVDLLLEQPVEEGEGEEGVSAKARQVMMLVQRLARQFINTYVRDGIARIMHPVHGGIMVDVRLAGLARMLYTVIMDVWNDVAAVIHSRSVPPDEAHRFVREAEAATRLAYLVLIEVYNELLNMWFINAPPEARPPLVNAALGYEIVGGMRVGVRRSR